LLKFYNVTEKEYGLIFALIASGLITASQLNNFLLKKFNSEIIIRTALLVQTLAGILLFVGSTFNLLELYSFIFLLFVFLSCQGFNFPNASALSMAPFEKEAGSASALMGSIQMGFGALAAACVGILNATTAVPMTGVMACCGLIALLIILFSEKKSAALRGDLTEVRRS
jgi:DHA1 family bicyclomycin/chloramphenicol resistance-like MFS transporter